jgi:esterase/lipase superfamily enzyme
LAQLAAPAPGSGSGGAPIEELFLNAPDFPVDQFQGLVERIKLLAKRVTIYCSYQDNAIAASELVNKNRRLGACERFDGVDVINVGEVDAPALGIGGLGHGYYASRAILTDIFQALLGVEADRRLFVRAAEPNRPENFFLRP